MKKNKRAKKIRNLVFVCVLTAILFTVSTYAWFIGMQTVNVNAFDVEIAAAEGLLLSVDGVKFADTVTIDGTEENQALIKSTYATNTNKWSDLKPISTVGKMDSDSNESRMIIYEKSSLTAKEGGYRLLSEQLENKTAEADGYVVFDLFVKNISGEKYYEINDEDNEEAIYLTFDSSVEVGNSGKKDTGIENSVRVAFAQIGRVKDGSDSSLIQKIDCDGTETGVTGICRDATIWEPNDTDHIENAISWYEESCKPRAGDEDTCTAITDGEYYDTYAVNSVIGETTAEGTDYVDIYDGYNGYTTSIGEEKYLYNVDTFRDTEKDKKGNERIKFMSFAPNSITKVRVYIYLEGQDIDNYDFASLGKQIKVNFGFTKERYTTNDYENEPVTVIPGAEDTNRINYEATDTVSEISDAGVIYDTESKRFYYHELDDVTTFEFKDGENEKVATLEDGEWTITDKE